VEEVGVDIFGLHQLDASRVCVSGVADEAGGGGGGVRGSHDKVTKVACGATC
jgi:hypothetical protein